MHVSLPLATLSLIMVTLSPSPALATGWDLYAAGTGYCASTYEESGHQHTTASGFGPAVDLNADGGDLDRPIYAPEDGTVTVFRPGGTQRGAVEFLVVCGRASAMAGPRTLVRDGAGSLPSLCRLPGSPSPSPFPHRSDNAR